VSEPLPDRVVPEAPSANGRRSSILVIDDRSENRMLIRYLFEAEHVVLEADSGETGLAVAREARPDCILLDVAMPRMSGFDVLDQLGADPRTREIPIIILTATEESLSAMERALRSGAVDYLTKPIDPHRVSIRVRGAIERARLLDELRALRANFTSMLVHDLRAPLTVIGGYTQLLKAALGDGDPNVTRYVRRIQDSADRMLDLIRDILDVSKVEAGKLAIERQLLDVPQVVRDVVEAFQPAARRRELSLTAVGVDTPRPVHADAARLEQVMMNLLANALKFTPPGGKISVEVGGDGAGVTVAVRDTGPGIPKAERALLFQPFSQTSVGVKATTPGTGLGLVICRHLIEAHGGRIWAEDTAHGCCFVFRLPVDA